MRSSAVACDLQDICAWNVALGFDARGVLRFWIHVPTFSFLKCWDGALVVNGCLRPWLKNNGANPSPKTVSVCCSSSMALKVQPMFEEPDFHQNPKWQHWLRYLIEDQGRQKTPVLLVQDLKDPPVEDCTALLMVLVSTFTQAMSPTVLEALASTQRLFEGPQGRQPGQSTADTCHCRPSDVNCDAHR